MPSTTSSVLRIGTLSSCVRKLRTDLRHVGVDRQADHVAEPAPLDHGLEQPDQILGLLLDLDVAVAQDPEEAAALALEAGEQEIGEAQDQLLEPDEARMVAGQADEALELAGQQHEAGEQLAAAAVELHGDADAGVGDERERVGRVDGDRGEDRDRLLVEALAQIVEIVPGQLVDLEHGHVLLAQQAGELVPAALLDRGQRGDALPDRRQLLGRREPVGTDRRDRQLGPAPSGPTRGPCRTRRDCCRRSTGSAAAPAADSATLLASSSTRSLKASQDSSRLMKCSGLQLGQADLARGRLGRKIDGLLVHGLRSPAAAASRAMRPDADGAVATMVLRGREPAAPLAHSRSPPSRCSSCFSCATPSPAGTSRASADHDRDLAPRGLQAASRMGGCCASGTWRPTSCCARPRGGRRTPGSWRRRRSVRQPPVRFDERLYLAAPERMIAVARELGGDARRLLLVGHDPGMHRLAVRLAGSGDARLRDRLAAKFPTAGLARYRARPRALGRLQRCSPASCSASGARVIWLTAGRPVPSSGALWPVRRQAHELASAVVAAIPATPVRTGNRPARSVASLAAADSRHAFKPPSTVMTDPVICRAAGLARKATAAATSSGAP